MTRTVRDEEPPELASFPGRHPVPGSPGLRYTPGVGLWRGKTQLLDWCPEVTRHLGVSTRAGELTRREVTVKVGQYSTTVPIGEVAEGKLWREKLPGTRGTAGREVREALVNVVEDQAAELPIIPALAHWTEGRLALPPLDTLPRGYGERVGTPADFAELLRVTTEAPRVALEIAAVAGALYIEPIRTQSHVWHTYGQGRRGKSTALYAAAAVVGFPGHSVAQPTGGVILSWNTTGLGPTTWLRELGSLPGFRDDLGAAAYNAAARSKVIFGMTQGTERDASTRNGLHRQSVGGWHGAVFSTGNERFTAGITNEGVATRLVELSVPMTPTPQASDRVETAARAAYGHGLAAIAERGWTPQRFQGVYDTVSAELGIAAGSVERTHGLYAALAVTGARLLAELFEVPEFAATVFDVARGVLDEMGGALADRGDSPGARLLDAITEDMASRGGMYPTRAVAAQHKQWPGDRGEIVGYDLAHDDEPGDVAMLPNHLRELAKRHGIEDADAALGELETSGHLRRGDRKHRARLLRLPGSAKPPKRCYVLWFRLDGDSDEDAPVPDELVPDELVPDELGHGPADDATDTVPTETATEATTDPVAAEACPRCPIAGPWCGFGATATTEELCVLCGTSTRMRSACGAARHGNCRPPESAGEALAPTAGPGDTGPAPSGAESGTPAALAEVTPDAEQSSIDPGTGLDDDTPGDPEPESEPTEEDLLVAGVEEAERLTAERVAHDSTEATSTEPTSTAPAPRPATPTITGEDAAAELANVSRVIRNRWPDADEGDIAAALDAWHQATNGLRFVSYPGEVGVAALHRLVSANHSMQLPVKLDDHGPVAEITESGRLLRYAEWVTPGVELDGRSVTSLDVNGQYLAAARSVELGDGQPVSYNRPRGGVSELVKLPGYVLLGAEVNTRHPALGTIAKGSLLAMPTVAYLLRDCGVEVDAERVVVWHEHGRRLSAWAGRFAEALASLPAGRDVPTTYARALVKEVYVAYLGGMLRSQRWNGLPRPDWSDQVVTQAEANKLRALDKATAAGAVVLGSWRDAAWFVADDAPHEPPGLTVSTQLGKWKVERYAEVSPELVQAYASGSPSVFRDALKAANDDRMTGGVR